MDTWTPVTMRPEPTRLSHGTAETTENGGTPFLTSQGPVPPGEGLPFQLQWSQPRFLLGRRLEAEHSHQHHFARWTSPATPQPGTGGFLTGHRDSCQMNPSFRSEGPPVNGQARGQKPNAQAPVYLIHRVFGCCCLLLVFNCVIPFIGCFSRWDADWCN